MLFWKKICLIWNFSKIKQIRSKMISSLKIKIIFHKTWQISDFSIFKSLNNIVSQMITKRLKNEILKFCYESYRNFWFLIKKKNLKNIDLSTRRWKWIKSRFETQIFFFDKWFFEIIRWLYDDFFDEFVFKIRSIFFDWNFSKFDWISNFDRINLNDDFFSKND